MSKKILTVGFYLIALISILYLFYPEFETRWSTRDNDWYQKEINSTLQSQQFVKAKKLLGEYNNIYLDVIEENRDKLADALRKIRHDKFGQVDETLLSAEVALRITQLINYNKAFIEHSYGYIAYINRDYDTALQHMLFVRSIYPDYLNINDEINQILSKKFN